MRKLLAKLSSLSFQNKFLLVVGIGEILVLAWVAIEAYRASTSWGISPDLNEACFVQIFYIAFVMFGVGPALTRAKAASSAG